MTNLLDYLASEFALFEEAPLNPVDSAAISQIAMVCADGIVPELSRSSWISRAGRTLLRALPKGKTTPAPTNSVQLWELLRAERYATMFTGPAKSEVKETLLHMAASPRFRDIRLSNYASVFDEETHTQFAAVTLTYKDQFAYVAFRGTDSSIVGWREDFNMSFSSPVPAQAQAVAYLEAVAPYLPKRLYMGGHSKGANLAEYAALKADPKIQARLECVFLHDGPGFKDGIFTEADYAPLEGRLHKTVPEDALVGMLLNSHAPYRVVKSDEHGFAQHNVFLWEVDGRDFAYAEKLSDHGRALSDILCSWVESYTEEERRIVVDALFTAIELSGASDILDPFSSPKRALTLLTEAARHTDGARREIIIDAVRNLADITADRIGQSVSDLLPRRIREAD